VAALGQGILLGVEQSESLGLAVVAAYTDMKGDTDKDRVLTEARAMVVREYLVENFKFDDTRSDRGRGVWLKNYSEEAEKAVRKRLTSKGLADKEFGNALYNEAWRYYTLELKDTIVKGMAVAVKRILFDLTPEGRPGDWDEQLSYS